MRGHEACSRPRVSSPHPPDSRRIMKQLQSLGLLVLTGLAASLLAATHAGPPVPIGSDDRIERTGTVDAWHVLANGTVSLRLTGRAKDQAFTSWFTTPSDKTEATR